MHIPFIYGIIQFKSKTGLIRPCAYGWCLFFDRVRAAAVCRLIANTDCSSVARHIKKREQVRGLILIRLRFAGL